MVVGLAVMWMVSGKMVVGWCVKKYKHDSLTKCLLVYVSRGTRTLSRLEVEHKSPYKEHLARLHAEGLYEKYLEEHAEFERKFEAAVLEHHGALDDG